ncbi:hypothetical protein OsJ_09952 [Oryza sativa Japonica Group]|uniref:Uncharacterized protein n=1 Tax=Oryza sativa subsp. japonica TaxID=39947 RepID=B9F694_ORYSJ|nr:hypothetical protein OsJ_09952 [Oryza sativa Japonica Group]
MAMEICAEAFPLSRFPTLEKSYCADSRDTERSHNTNWITEVHFSNRGSNKLWISEVAKIKKRIRSLNLRKSLGQARFSSSTGCIHEQLLKLPFPCLLKKLSGLCFAILLYTRFAGYIRKGTCQLSLCKGFRWSSA